MASRTAIQGCADACTACPRLVLADEEPDTFTGLTGFLIERALRFAGGGVMAEFQEDENHQYLTMAAPAAIAEWMLHDVWDAETACQLVVLGYKLPRPTWKFLKELDALDALDLLDLPAVLNKLRERHACDASDEQQIQDTLDAMDSLDVRDIRDDLRWLGMLVEKGAVNPQFVRTICAVYDRAKAIADSSVNAGTICEHDTPENWRRWAQGKGYSVAHLMPTYALAAKVGAGTVTSPSGNTVEEQADVDHDERLAALFDPQPVDALEKMFPADGKWGNWAERAKANGLKDARVARAKFNPYKAGVWFVKKGSKGWDDARL